MKIILKVCEGRCKTVFGCERSSCTNGGKNQYFCGSCWLTEPVLRSCPWGQYGGKKKALLPEDGQNGIKIERTLCFYCKKYPKVDPGRFNIRNLEPT